MSKRKKIIIAAVLIGIIGVLEVSYAFFNYYMKGTMNHHLIAGEVYLNLVEGTDTLNLTNIFPETKEEARSRTDNVITFTINGKNTMTDNDVYYEIMLNEGDAHAGKTRFNPEDLVFDLVEVINGEERMVINARSFGDINARRIWVNTVNRNTTANVSITYKLRMWLSERVIISDTESYANYTTEEFRNSYASVKVSVSGDFVEKTLTYNYLRRTGASSDLNSGEISNFWPTSIDNVKAKIIEVNFLELARDIISHRYYAAPIKADVSNNRSVNVWLEDVGNSQYKMYVASDGIIVFPSDCDCMFADFTNLKTINFNNTNTSQVTDMSGMFGGCSNLTNLDVSSFDTSQVTNMESMFAACSSLTSLNLSNFDTSQVTNMFCMFVVCSSLSNLDLSSFNTNIVTNVAGMFADVKSTCQVLVRDGSMQNWVLTSSNDRPTEWSTANVIIKS